MVSGIPFIFTTGWYPDNIEIKQSNIDVADDACLKCHQDIVDMMKGFQNNNEKISCVRCHTSIGHLD